MMDNVNSTNLYSVSVCDLNTKFTDRSHCDWSKTNLISVVSYDGIYILRPQLDVQNGPFRIELIRNPKEKFNHPAHCKAGGTTFDSIWQKLSSNQYMEVYLDPALLANVEKLNLDVYPRRFRMAKWSPLIDTYPRHCLLAVLTVDYQLLVYSRRNGVWIIQADLSRDYNELWTHLNSTSEYKCKGDQFESLKKTLHSLSFCNVCWKESRREGPLLMAATIPGDIVIWQTVSSMDCDGMFNYQERFDIKMILRTDLEYINNMELFDNLLIVSARDGQVVLYDLTGNFNDLETNLSLQHGTIPAAMKTLSVITIPPTVTLWHHDNIEVNDFYIQPITNDTFRIVLAKSTNICWCIINYKKRTNNVPATLGISDSFSAIDGLDPEVSLHQTPVTWLKPAGPKKAVLIANDGSFFQLEFVGDHQDTSPHFRAIKTGKVDLTNMVPYGLCSSIRGHLIALVSCISPVYDPSRVSAPTKVLILPTHHDKRFFVDCVGQLLDEGWLQAENVISPMDVCDRLDYLRSILPFLENEDIHELCTMFEGVVKTIGFPKNNTQLVILKITSFVLSRLQEFKKSLLLGDDKSVFIKRLNEHILLYNIGQVLNALFFKENSLRSEIPADLEVNQMLSLRNYFSWLDTFEEGRIFREKYLDCYKILADRYARLKHESCPICMACIPFELIDYGICNNGHQFSRCGRSLVIMNLKTGNEFVCDYCNRRYMTTLVWPSENKWLCSFCQ